MSHFGSQLRDAREAGGWSLDALSAETKIQRRHLEAMEREEFHELPGGIFRRGILRSYLHVLNLDEQDWMPLFEASVSEHARLRGENPLSGEEAWVRFASNVKKNRAARRRTTGLRWVGVAGLFVLLSAAGWATWMYLVAPRVLH